MLNRGLSERPHPESLAYALIDENLQHRTVMKSGGVLDRLCSERVIGNAHGAGTRSFTGPKGENIVIGGPVPGFPGRPYAGAGTPKGSRFRDRSIALQIARTIGSADLVVFLTQDRGKGSDDIVPILEREIRPVLEQRNADRFGLLCLRMDGKDVEAYLAAVDLRLRTQPIRPGYELEDLP